MKLKVQKHSKDNGYSHVWLTPLDTYKLLNDEFKFELDPCTEPHNPLGTDRFFTAEDNALTKDWKGNTFINPPYDDIAKWVEYTYQQQQKWGGIKVMLIPARTDTRYTHNFIFPYAEVRFIKGRIKFNNKGSAPFPSMIVIFGLPSNIKTQERR